MLQVREDAAHHRQQAFCHCQRVICAVSARWPWWLLQLLGRGACREVGCKVSQEEGCRPTQACPVHSPRLLDEKQMWKPYSSVNAQRHMPISPVYYQRRKPTHAHLSRLSNPYYWAILSSSNYREKNPPPTCPSQSASSHCRTGRKRRVQGAWRGVSVARTQAPVH